MAEQVPIQGNPEGAEAKIRSPLAVAVLSIVTLGIYILFWWYYVNKEMVQYGRAKGTDELGDSPGTSVVALFPGALVIVPAIMTLINTSKRTQVAARLSGRGEEGINGWIALILYIVIAPAFFAYLQSDLNKTWQRQVPATALPGDTAAADVGAAAPQTTTPETSGETPRS